MNIADVNFAIFCRESVLLQKLTPVYQPFLVKGEHTASTIKISIELELDNIPKTTRLTKIFEAEQSWAMFKDSDEYILAQSPPVFKTDPLSAVRFKSNPENAVIYCSDMLINRSNGKTTITNPFCFPLDQLMLMYILSSREGALIHSAGMIINGKGYIFPGRSGAGKSTLSRQFAGAKNSVMLSDDRMIARKIGDSFRIFGTPWPGEEKIAENKSEQLKGIFFISHSTENMVKDIKPVEALKKLMPVTSIPWFDKDVVPKILNFCEELVSNIPAYQFYFKPDTEVVKFLEEFDRS